MKSRNSNALNRYLGVCLLFLATISLNACGQRDLGDGYKLTTIYSGAHIIELPKSVNFGCDAKNDEIGNCSSTLICPNVSSVEYDDEYIVGVKETPDGGGHHECDQMYNGYLIIKKETVDIELGLTEEAFRQRCAELEISFCERVIEDN
ncbi:MAG: hypothetical protein EP347_04440 [Alphaproteobacteria bacterium]|nr:MAG: hypothetical protein EP347_04440 [Alphaproteobacteria bacterium]